MDDACEDHVKRRLKAGQVWEWSWNDRVEQHLLLKRVYRDQGYMEEWQSFRIDNGKLWTVSFSINDDDDSTWQKIS